MYGPVNIKFMSQCLKRWPTNPPDSFVLTKILKSNFADLIDNELPKIVHFVYVYMPYMC